MKRIRRSSDPFRISIKSISKNGSPTTSIGNRELRQGKKREGLSPNREQALFVTSWG
jgi:hypothetical protein